MSERTILETLKNCNSDVSCKSTKTGHKKTIRNNRSINTTELADEQCKSSMKEINSFATVHRRRSIVTLVCPHCDKVFSGDASFSGVRSNYRRHLLIHSHERPHQCVFCGDGFTTRQNMKRHVRLCHPALASPSLTNAHSPNAKLEETHTENTNCENNKTESEELRISSTNGMNVHSKSNTAFLESMTLPDSMQTFISKNINNNSAKTTCTTEGSLRINKNNVQMEAQQKENNSNTKSIDRQKCYNISGDIDCIQRPHDPHEKTKTSKETSESLVQKVTFTCADCEAELSSRTKLRRHMRFHCPFRDNVETDFVADLLVHKKKKAMRLIAKTPNAAPAAHIPSQTPHTSLSPKTAKGNKINNKNFKKLFFHYEEEDKEEEEEEEEEEEHYLRRVAEENKMRYYANANDSDNEDIESESESTQSSADEDNVKVNNTNHQHIYLHRKYNDDNDIEDTEVDDEWHNLQKLHLAYHRRRSGHKRSRRILRKRLRANEQGWEIMSNERELEFLNNNNLKNTESDRPVTETLSSEEDQISNYTTCKHKNINRDSEVLERYAHVSSSLYENAVAIASASHKQNNSNCKTSVVCPFESCEKSFAKRKYWLAHVARCHPVQYAEMRKNDVHTAEHLTS